MNRGLTLGGALLLAFGVAAPVQAQAGAEIGFRLGASIANISADDLEDTESLTGFPYGGGFVAFPLAGGMVSVMPGVYYAPRGVAGDLGFADVELKTDYVEIPLLLRLNLGSGGALVPYVAAGPVLGLNSTCKVEVEAGEDFEEDVDCDHPDFEDSIVVKGTDVGILGAAGVGFAAGPGRVLVDARYLFGLTEVFETVAGEDQDGGKHRVFTFSLGYSVPLSAGR